MATVTDRRVQPAPAKTEIQAAPKPRRRWRFFLGLALVCLLTLLALLPAIASRSPVSGWIVARATAGLNGEASVGSLHLGWFSSPVLADLEIRDSQRRTLLAVEQVHVERSLLDLLLSPSDLGRIRLEKPVLTIAYDGTGTNLEQVLARWLQADAMESRISAELAVASGTVVLNDIRSSRNWQVNQIDLIATVPAGERDPIDVRASGNIADAANSGRFALKLAVNRTAVREDPLSAIEALEAELENTPLEMFAPLLARSIPDTELGGCLSAFAKCEVTGGSIQPEMAIQLTAVVDDFLLAGSAVQGDRLAIDRIEAGGRASWRGRLIDIERLRVETELGNAVVSGGFNLPDESFTTLLKSLAEQTYRIEAGVNLASLASRLPNTLRLQQGLKIESGDATIVLESRRAGDTMRWDGRADVSRLSANRGGQQIRWPEPILASFSASKNPQGLSIERLQCQAKHLQLSAAGTPQQVDGSLSFDLAGLAEEVSQLVDLGGLKMSGNGRGRFQWQRQPDERYTADGQLQVDQFQLALGDQPAWSDPSLLLRGDIQGTLRASEIAVQSGKLQLQIGDDQVTASLAEPIDNISRAPAYPLNWKTEGDLARWSSRLGPILSLGQWQMAGQLNAEGRIDLAQQEATLRSAKIRVEELSVRSPRLNFYDPDVELTTAMAKWVPARSRIEIPSATMSGQTIGAGVEPLAVAWSGGNISQLDGTLAVRTTLDRLQQWSTATVTQAPKWMLQGNVAGRGNFRTAEGKTAFDGELSVDQLQASHQSGKKLEEARLRLTARGQYDPAARAITFSAAKLESGLVGADAAGKLVLSGAGPHVDLDGQYQYDLVRLSELGRLHLGIPLFAAGHDTSPFSYHGPLSPAEATAALDLKWTGAEIAGFLIGPGELKTQMAGGVAHANPVEVTVSEGRVALRPQVTFSPQGSILQVEPGRVADRIRISPQMCAGALQYIAPPLAGVATAEGTFSIEMEQCSIPLDAPEKGDLSGRMTVHAVSIGPGPLIRELAGALGFGRTAQLSRESTVPFRMVDGRVYHRDLELVFPEVTMKTFGSVGLDQSLALIVEMPIPDKWRTGNQTIDSAIANQALRLPIGGSLMEPAIDRRELERQAGQFMQGAVRNVLEKQLNQQLQRLLQPK